MFIATLGALIAHNKKTMHTNKMVAAFLASLFVLVSMVSGTTAYAANLPQANGAGGGGGVLINNCVWTPVLGSRVAADPANWKKAVNADICDISDVNNKPVLTFDDPGNGIKTRFIDWTDNTAPVSGSSIVFKASSKDDRLFIGTPVTLNSVNMSAGGMFLINGITVTFGGNITLDGDGYISTYDIGNQVFASIIVNKNIIITDNATQFAGMGQFNTTTINNGGALTLTGLRHNYIFGGDTTVIGTGAIVLKDSNIYVKGGAAFHLDDPGKNFVLSGSTTVTYTDGYAGTLLPAYDRVAFENATINNLGNSVVANGFYVDKKTQFNNVDITGSQVQFNADTTFDNSTFTISSLGGADAFNDSDVTFNNSHVVIKDNAGFISNHKTTFATSTLTMGDTSYFEYAGSGFDGTNGPFENNIVGADFNNATIDIGAHSVFKNSTGSKMRILNSSFHTSGADTQIRNDGGMWVTNSTVSLQAIGENPILNAAKVFSDGSDFTYDGVGPVNVITANSSIFPPNRDSGYNYENLIIGKNVQALTGDDMKVRSLTNNGSLTIPVNTQITVTDTLNNTGLIQDDGVLSFKGTKVRFSNNNAFLYESNDALYPFTDLDDSPVYVWFEDKSRNLDGTKPDVINGLTLHSTYGKDTIAVSATETGTSTGQFLAGPITLQVANQNKPGALTVAKNDSIDATYEDPKDSSDTFTTVQPNNNYLYTAGVSYSIDGVLNASVDQIATTSFRMSWVENPKYVGKDITYTVSLSDKDGRNALQPGNINFVTGSNDTEFIFTQLAPSTTYFAQVTVVDAFGNNSFPTVVSATTRGVPAGFSSITAQPFATDSIYVSWTQASHGSENEYIIYQDGVEALRIPALSNGKYVTGYIVNGLTPNTAYRFSVAATDGVEVSDTINAIVAYTYPTAPTIVKKHVDSETGFTVSVSNSANGAKLLDVDTNKYIVTVESNLGDSMYDEVVTGMKCATTYTVAAVAIGNDSNLLSEPTVPISITTNACAQDPAVLDHITISPATTSVEVGATTQFTITAYDQYGAEFVKPIVGWKVDNNAGMIDANGVFTASNNVGGPYVVTAADGSGNFSDTAEVTVVPKVFVNHAPTIVNAAAVNPSPVVGTFGTLTVLADDVDDGEASLSYAWVQTAGPVPALIGNNNSNAAKNTAVNFVAAGAYTFEVTVTDQQGKKATSSVDVTVAQTVTQISVSPANPSVQTNDVQGFAVSAFDQFGASMDAPAVIWSVSDNQIIDKNSGVFTAGANAGGPYIVTADYNGIQATAQVTVIDQPFVAMLSSIKVSPASVNLTQGDTQNFTVKAYDQNGNQFNPTPVVTWSVNNNGAIDGNMGVFTADMPGVFTVTANDGNAHVASAQVVVKAKPIPVVSSIQVLPTPVTLVVGDTQQFTVTALDQFNNVINPPVVIWSVDNNGTINAQTGEFTANTEGNFTVTADAGNNIKATATVTVNAKQGGGANQAPTVAKAAAADMSPVTGTGTNLSVLGADDKGELNLAYSWKVTGPASVTFSKNGSNAAQNTIVTFTKAGDYTFTVTITDQDGMSVDSVVMVSVNQTLTSLLVSPANTTLTTGNVQQYSVAAADQFGNSMAVPAVTWTISAGGSIDQNGLLTAGANAGGPFIVTADDKNGHSGSTNVTVVVQSNVGGGQANNGGGGGGGGAVTPVPANPQVAVKVGSINTTNNTVVLLLSATNTPTLMAISATSSFTGISFVPYATSSVWNFGPVTGPVTVYAKFANNSGSSLATSTTFTVVRLVNEPIKEVLGEKISRLDDLIAMTKYGEKSANVKELQAELKKAGYFAKSWKSTTYYGTATRAAVQKYQADKLSLDDLIAQTKYGQNNYKVFRLQTELKKSGYFAKKWKPTYFYGAATKAAVAKYQATK